MKRGYLWVDWIELGSRGWDIDQTGAGLDADDNPARCCAGDFAHVDRTTLDLAIGGCRRFVARVWNDCAAAGLFYWSTLLRSLNCATESTWTGTSDTTEPHYWQVNLAAFRHGEAA